MDGAKDDIVAWLVAPTTVLTPAQLFTELSERLSAFGLSLQRGSASLMTKHPDVFGTQLVWMRGAGTQAVPRSHAVIASSMYASSPAAHVRRTGQALRARLESLEEPPAFDLYRELRDAGLTDYYIAPMPFRSGMRSFVSWATDRPGGFHDDELALIDSIIPALSLRWELESATYALSSLMTTYLGHDAAARVLGGEFRRGSGSRIQAIIWSADLRDFTVLVDEHGVDEAMQTLDEYFGCVAAPIGAHGGEILKFIGDAVLAVFPIGDESPRAVCARALAALDDAEAARAKVDTARGERGVGPLRFGIALHIGEVFYGNIGVPGRLDFTVIGRAVNEACRVESLTKRIGAPFLATDAFVRAAETDRASSVGEHEIVGISAPMQLYAIRSP